MDCVASIYRKNNNKIYHLCSMTATQRLGMTTGYYTTTNGNEIIDLIKKQLILNYIQHKGERTSHLLFQPFEPTKDMLKYFCNSQYCIGVAKGLRDRKDPKNFFNADTKYVDASGRSISTGKPVLTLVPEMNLSHALNSKQTINVLKCIINNAGVKIEDILIFNLTTGGFWQVVSI